MADRDVFECLVQLYGFGVNRNERTRPQDSTHIVVLKQEILT